MHSNSPEQTTQNTVVLSSDDEQNDKQIVLYNPTLNGPDPEPDPDPIHWRPLLTNSEPKVLPSIGAFTVQCAMCYKWRLIPTKEKYEEIRENILKEAFVCEVAKEWRPEISCEEASDVEQDGSLLWAIDKPSIAQTPFGWDRELRIRGEGSTKFADVYYVAPSGKKLRSIVEVEKYLFKHPEFIDQGIKLSQFSFKIPKPLQENYVRKGPACKNAPCNETNLETSRPLDQPGVNLISWDWAPSETLQLTEPGFPGSPTMEDSPLDTPPTKKARSSTEPMYNCDTLHIAHIRDQRSLSM